MPRLEQACESFGSNLTECGSFDPCIKMAPISKRFYLVSYSVTRKYQAHVNIWDLWDNAETKERQ